MSQPYVGQIILVGFNFAPVGYALCQGQVLSIEQNPTLFNLIGTMYGGDGVNTFVLPDLRGRIQIGSGSGVGLSSYSIGQNGGAEAVALTAGQLPQHTHALDASGLTATARCKNDVGNQQTPVGNVPAIEAAGVTMTDSSAAPDASMNSNAVVVGGSLIATNTGGGQSHSNIQPYLTLSYCIALTGLFPSQN